MSGRSEETSNAGSSQNRNKKCGVCKKNVTSNQNGLNCEYCSTWFHTECEHVNEEQYEFIRAQGEQLHWFCKRCNPKALDVMKLVQGLRDKHDELQTRVEELESKVNTMDDMKGEFKDKVTNVVREEMYEMREKESKENNIVLRNVFELDDPETVDDEDDEDDGEEADDDTGRDEENRVEKNEGRKWSNESELVNHILQNVLENENIEVTATKRVPNTRREGQNRMIIVTLRNKQMRDQVLRSAKNLRRIPEWDGVYIGPDLTKKERESDYNLRQELKRRRNNGEKNLMIRRGHIVTKEEFTGQNRAYEDQRRINTRNSQTRGGLSYQQRRQQQRPQNTNAHLGSNLPPSMRGRRGSNRK